jgi:DNA-binding response OmpR family regulator
VHLWFLLEQELLPQRRNQAAKSIVAVGKSLPVLLTPTEFSLLAYLAQNVDRVVPQDQLLEEV